jgi:DNA-binding beta-propeller fold protein YncE
MSPDDRRTFILNQGGNTITVLDSQQNRIDTNFPNGITVGNGPVWADILNNASVLAVANSRDNTVSLINISLDAFGNDGPNFGQTIATIPVGPNPSSLSILQDGSQLFVANRNDPTNSSDPSKNGSVSAINLTTNTVSATIRLPQQPCTGNPTAMCNVHPISIAATTGTPLGKVYVASPDTNMLTIIRTDNDTIYENLPLTGNGVQVRVTSP